MNFETFIETAWSDHGEQPGEVAARLARSLDMLESPSHLPPFARIVAHVYGEHLARWREGIELLESLRGHRCGGGDDNAAAAVGRSIAVLRYAGNLEPALEHLPAEDRITVLATAASALAAQGNFERAIESYLEAARLAEPGLPPGSPAARALAAGGNNLAVSLEEKPDRDAFETRGMLDAAEAALKYWRIAGTWLEEERALYRLARSLLEAGDHGAAIEASLRCIEACAANRAPAFEMFFGHAALAVAQRRGGDQCAFEASRAQALRCHEALAPDERRWCETALEEINA